MGSRPLTAGERAIAESMYGSDGMNYDEVKIYDDGWFPGATRVMAPDGNIHYPSGHSAYATDISGGNLDQKSTLIHELWHRKQWEEYPWTFKMRAATQRDYDYREIFDGTAFKDLGIEEQAQFLQDIYILRNGGTVPGNTKTLQEYEDALPDDFLDSTFSDTNQNDDATTEKQLNQIAPEGGDDGDSEDTDTYADEIEDTMGEAENKASPLVLDLDGDGIELISLNSANAVYWDIDNDGFAEASGWVAPDDGMLAIDLNQDGIINNNHELFGSVAEEGFQELSLLDSNADGIIDANDEKFSELLVWKDSNGDGNSQQSELFSLTDLNIKSINLSNSRIDTTVAGNFISNTSTFTYTDNSTGTISDVWFRYSDLNTVHDQAYELDDRVLDLPTVRGYGELPSLHIAMSLDNGTGGLLEMVQDLTSKDAAALFASDMVTDVKNIMYKWANVDDLDPASRGPNVDARSLAFVEKFSGRDFLQLGYLSNPRVQAGKAITDAFNNAHHEILARIVLQSDAAKLFERGVSYDYVSDSFDTLSALDTTFLSDLSDSASSAPDTLAFWENVLLVVATARGEGNITTADINALNAAIYDSDSALSYTSVYSSLFDESTKGITINGDNADNVLSGTINDDRLVGNGGHDTLNGDLGDDVLEGDGGNDILNGGYGADILYGDAGDDILNGGYGEDLLYGGAGTDTFVYNLGDGVDTIRDDVRAETGDKILFGAGISLNDLTFLRMGNNDLSIRINAPGGTGEIVVENQFYASSGGVDFLEFSDSTTFDLTSLNYTLTGTDRAETLHGVQVAGGFMDTIFGEGGNDSIEGDNGNDTLYGGTGDDNLYGQNDDDALYGDEGNDYLDGGSGNDRLEGGVGNDTLLGKAGNDVYVYTSGNDIFNESGSEVTGIDEINMPAGIIESDLTFTRISGTDLRIDIAGLGSIIIKNQFYGSNGGYSIETIRLADDSTINLMTKEYISQGTSGNDNWDGIVSGGSIIDTLYMNDGNDIVTAGNGNDIVYGGNGNDSLYGENGDDSLYGDAGADALTGGTGNDRLEGGVDNDTLYGNAGSDIYVYTSGDDIFDDNVNEAAGIDEIHMPAGITESDLTFTRISGFDLRIDVAGLGSIIIKNQFYGSTGGYSIETIRLADDSTINLMTKEYVGQGTSGNDNWNGIIAGGSNIDTLYMNDGNDTVSAGAGNDIVYGGNGSDNLNGGDGNDALYGDAGNDTLTGGTGNDRLEGGADNDTLYGNTGSDIYVYTSGGDIFDDNVNEAAGIDEIHMPAGITESDLTFTRISGTDLRIDVAGLGSITVKNQFYGSTGGYSIETIRLADDSTINLMTKEYIGQGTSGNDNWNGIIAGGSNIDTLYMNDGNDTVSAGAGNDIVYGEGGNDSLNGGDGDDTLHGGAGNDALVGNAGNDTYIYSSGLDTITDSSGTDTLYLEGVTTVNDVSFSSVSTYNTKITLSAGVDEITLVNLRHGTIANHVDFIEFADGFKTSLPDYAGWTNGTAGADTLTGTSGDNTIIGKDGNDTLDGAGGNDDIHGGSGNDTLYGGAGADLLHGGVGDDTLYGQDGLDTLFGGAGADTFVFQAASAFNNLDVIKDFSTAQNDVLDLSDLLGGYDPLTDAITDFVWITESAGNSNVFVDRDGLGGTHSLVVITTLSGVTGLTDEAALLSNGTLIA